MIKQMVEWTGFDGRPTSKTFFFNLTEIEVRADMELEKLQERFERFEEEVIKSSNSREMTPPEVREMLDIIKTIIKHSYGVRSADGTRFDKDEPAGSGEIWREFVATGGYDAFLRDLFSNPDRANSFMRGIWPEVMMIPEADKAPAQTESIPGTVIDLDAAVTQSGDTNADDYQNYQVEELLAMSDENFNAVLERSKKGKNVPYDLLQVAMQRSSGNKGE